MADPHGPIINGKDIFKQSALDALTPYGITVAWVEDWDFYHAYDGEVHCGTNSRRPIPSNIRWWENMP